MQGTQYYKTMTNKLKNKIMHDHNFSEEAAEAIVKNIPKDDIYQAISEYIGKHYVEDGYSEVMDGFANSTTSLADRWSAVIQDGEVIVYDARD